MSPFYYVLTLLVVFGTPLVIFAMKYASSAYQARTKESADENYRALTERCVAMQAEANALLSAIRGELSQVADRVSAIEEILKAVE